MKTGIFPTMSNAEYHALDAIGSSTLVEIENSPKHFYHAWKGPKEESTPAQIKGTLIHSLLLEQDIKHYVPRPLDEKGNLIKSNSKEYAAFLEQNPGKTAVHPDDFNEMYQMLTAFADNKRAMMMLRGAKVEQSIVAQDPETGLYLKARPDIWGPGFIADLKSTSNIKRFEYQIFDMMYDIRLVHYAKAVEIETGEKIDQFFFIAYESSAPYCSKIYKLKIADIERAANKHRIMLNRVSVCLKANEWPGYDDSILMATRPRFFEDETISFEGVG